MPASAAVPFFHSHKANEENYIILSGSGKFQVNDDVFDIAEGSADLDGNVEVTAGDFEVKMYSAGKDGEAYVYLAMLPGQTVSSGTQLFRFRSESGQEVPCDALDADVVLSSGNMTELSRTVEGLIHTVRIEPGTFVMGSPETEQGHTSYEKQHTVTLSTPFYMSTMEITNAQYAEFLNSAGMAPGNWWDTTLKGNVEGYGTYTLCEFGSGNNIEYDGTLWYPTYGKENMPMNYVSWYGAMAYALWAGATLPTEAQWEYACRAGTETAWSFGNDSSLAGDYAWFSDNSDSAPGETGAKLPNGWGLYDMHGNLYEWCSDWFDNDYGIEDLTSETSVTDPTGPDSGMYKVIRGGSWLNYWYYCRSGYRNVYFPNYVSDLAGFRVVFKTK